MRQRQPGEREPKGSEALETTERLKKEMMQCDALGLVPVVQYWKKINRRQGMD